MSAEEKILQGIIADAEMQADKIKNTALAECESINAKVAEDKKVYEATTVSAALFKAKSIKQNAESAAELTVRDAKLAKKHSEIEKTLAMAEERINFELGFFAHLITNIILRECSQKQLVSLLRTTVIAQCISKNMLSKKRMTTHISNKKGL